jgi:hypothetical protein
MNITLAPATGFEWEKEWRVRQRPRKKDKQKMKHEPGNTQIDGQVFECRLIRRREHQVVSSAEP